MQSSQAVWCVILFLSLRVRGYNYCFKNCGTMPHVLCGVRHRCAETACEENEPDYEWRSVLLNIHNQMRERVASGQETRGGNGPSSSMRAFSYDLELEAVAACALYRGSVRGVQCLNTRHFYLVGMNLLRSEVIDPCVAPNIKAAVHTWYEQAAASSAAIIDRYPARRTISTNYSMFTQLVWARTTHLGCARCRRDDTFMMMCLYAPSGNIPDNKVYRRGPPASYCPPDHPPNKQFPGLCGPADLPQNASEPGLHLYFLAAPVGVAAPPLHVLLLAAAFALRAVRLWRLP